MKTLQQISNSFSKTRMILGLLFLLMSIPAFAHCDSYDGPVIKDAIKALEKENVNFVKKWIEPQQEAEIIKLFNKTVSLKNKDAEIYSLVEKHFFETLVRYHRETEGAPYTGLKPAGSTEPIIQMADNSLASSNVKTLLHNLGNHIQKVITEKYEKAAALSTVKDHSVAEGRAYVAAYVDYTHTLEALEKVMSHGAAH